MAERSARANGLILPVLAAALLLNACGTPAGGTTTDSEAEPSSSIGDGAALDCVLPDGPVVIAAAARARTAAPKVTGKVSSVLQHAIDSQAQVTVLDTDRAPTLVTEGSMTVDSATAEGRAGQVRIHTERLGAALHASEADQPQADPLAALDIASRTVHGRGDTGTVVLMDSGLQTAGALRYQSGGLLLASGTDVVTHLRTSRQLPDLSGITLLLVGIGDTAPPQARLDAATRSRLVEHWTAVSEAAGAQCVEVDTEPLLEPPPPGLPEVAEVRAPEPVQPRIDERDPVALREDSVGFLDDSADLRDPTAARTALEPLAQDIVEAGYRVTLVGTTATAGTEEGRRNLSLLRAETVQRLLVDLGVPDARITTRGVGTHHPLHVDDIDAQGNLIPAAALQNRAVFVEVRR